MRKGDAHWPPKKENWRRDQEAFVPSVEVDLSRWESEEYTRMMEEFREKAKQERDAGRIPSIMQMHAAYFNKYDHQLAQVEMELVRMLAANDPVRFGRDDRLMRRMWTQRIGRYRDLVHDTIVAAADDVGKAFKAIYSARDIKWERERDSIINAWPARPTSFTKGPLGTVWSNTPNPVQMMPMSVSNAFARMIRLTMLTSRPVTMDELDPKRNSEDVTYSDAILSLCVIRIGITKDLHDEHMAVLRKLSDWGGRYVGEEDPMAGFRFCAAVEEMIASQA